MFLLLVEEHLIQLSAPTTQNEQATNATSVRGSGSSVWVRGGEVLSNQH
jgi:hypothetical protein